MSDRKNNSIKHTKKNHMQEEHLDEKVDDNFDLNESKKDAQDPEKKEEDIHLLQEQLEKLQDESKENLDKVLRAQAEAGHHIQGRRDSCEDARRHRDHHEAGPRWRLPTSQRLGEQDHGHRHLVCHVERGSWLEAQAASSSISEIDPYPEQVRGEDRVTG